MAGFLRGKLQPLSSWLAGQANKPSRRLGLSPFPGFHLGIAPRVILSPVDWHSGAFSAFRCEEVKLCVDVPTTLPNISITDVDQLAGDIILVYAPGLRMP
jgi:hypothetical protein